MKLQETPAQDMQDKALDAAAQGDVCAACEEGFDAALDADFDEDAQDPDFEPDEAEEPEPEPLTPQQELAALVYTASGYSALVKKSELLENELLGTPEEIEAMLADLSADEVLANIKVVVGKKDTYYYDASIMSNRFAKVESMLQDKDMLVTIADVVRTDSKLYPRTTFVGNFTEYPYYFTLGEIKDVLARMKEMKDYQDIAVVRTGNGKDCVYSTLHLSFARARYLAEKYEGEESEAE